MTMLRWFLTIISFLFPLAAAAVSSIMNAREEQKTTNLLLVGNSYTSANSLNRLIEGLLLASSGEDSYYQTSLRVDRYTKGGWQFHQHLDDADGINGDSNQLRKWLVTGNPTVVPWTWVVLQEQSQLPGLPGGWYEGSLDAAIGLDAHVQKTGGETIFFMTWGRRDGDRKMNPSHFPDFLTMNARLKAGYEGYVRATTTNDRRTTRAAPVGPAFEYIYRDIESSGGNPLEEGSEFYSLFSGDGSHPSLTGSYLAACVLYATMTKRDPRGLAYRPDGLSADQQVRLQSVAYWTVLDYGGYLPASEKAVSSTLVSQTNNAEGTSLPSLAAAEVPEKKKATPTLDGGSANDGIIIPDKEWASSPSSLATMASSLITAMLASIGVAMGITW